MKFCNFNVFLFLELFFRLFQHSSQCLENHNRELLKLKREISL